MCETRDVQGILWETDKKKLCKQEVLVSGRCKHVEWCSWGKERACSWPLTMVMLHSFIYLSIWTNVMNARVGLKKQTYARLFYENNYELEWSRRGWGTVRAYPNSHTTLTVLPFLPQLFFFPIVSFWYSLHPLEITIQIQLWIFLST